MNLEIRINTDNDAFWQGDKSGRVMREELTHLVTSAVDHYVAQAHCIFEHECESTNLQDGNGNTVGVVRTFGNDSDYFQKG